jgi:tetratricopeptide (TPR) repeat protein
MDEEWEQRVAEAWATVDDLDEAAFLRQMQRLAEQGPAPDGLFERASAFDSTGHSDTAVPLYQEALERGLAGERRRRATIQLASSLRNLGRAEEALALLESERYAASDELDDAVIAFLALVLADLGREREALSMTLRVLAHHLPRYQRSMANYGRLLLESGTEAP